MSGVSALHSEILKDRVFNDFYKIYSSKFCNVTNGIASRRWLYQSNPRLNNYIKELIGDGFMHDMTQLQKLMDYKDDKQVHEQLAKIKLANKQDFAAYIKEHTGQVIDPNSMFDVQVKRLHEYKRQHLNALHILALYNEIKHNPNHNIQPTTFIFGAKAAPGYYMAKQIIKFICSLGQMIENDPQARDILKIVYLEDYRVTLSELLMPASEVSEQISLAGTEASGTGNMKLMMNGAVTIGTLDGANVEMYERLGDDNMFLFGLRANEVEELRRSGYDPQRYANEDERLRRVLQRFNSGLADGKSYADLVSSLLYGGDQYMLIADFASYVECHDRLYDKLRDKREFARMGLVNIAESGIFAADRAVREYAQRIWKI